MSRSTLISNALVVTRSRALVLTLLFVLIQFSSLLHATEHPFHAEVATCDVYLSVENGKSTFSDTTSDAFVSYAIDSVVTDISSAFKSSVVSVYRSRAPPHRSFS